MIPGGLLFFFYFIVFNTQRHVIINLWKAKEKRNKKKKNCAGKFIFGKWKIKRGKKEGDFLLFLFLSNTFPFTLIYNRNQKSLKAFPSFALFILFQFIPIFHETIANEKQFHVYTGRIGKLLFSTFYL